jgi:hypothetical protein
MALAFNLRFGPGADITASESPSPPDLERIAVHVATERRGRSLPGLDPGAQPLRATEGASIPDNREPVHKQKPRRLALAGLMFRFRIETGCSW